MVGTVAIAARMGGVYLHRAALDIRGLAGLGARLGGFEAFGDLRQGGCDRQQRVRTSNLGIHQRVATVTMHNPVEQRPS